MRYRHSTVAEKAYAENSCLFPNHASPQNFEFEFNEFATLKYLERITYKWEINKLKCVRSKEQNFPSTCNQTPSDNND